MIRRQGQTSVIHSKKFVVTAGISVVFAGFLLATVAGIVPVPAWTESWSSDDAPWSQEESHASAGKNRRSGGLRNPTQRSASRQRSGFLRRLGRGLARVLIWGGRNRAGRSSAARYSGRSAAPKKNRAQRRGRKLGNPQGGQPAVPTAPTMDSTQFGVGTVGLGLEGNGGPIAAGAAPQLPGAPDSKLEYDPYFDPNEAIPTVQPSPARSRSQNTPAGAPHFNQGPTRSRRGLQTTADLSREKTVEFGGRGDGPSDGEPTQQETGDDSWADEKGGGKLKKYRTDLPEIGAGKKIRNAPSRTR